MIKQLKLLLNLLSLRLRQPRSQVKVAADDSLVPEVDVGTPLVHTSLLVIATEEIVDESPSHDLQEVMEGGANLEKSFQFHLLGN